MDAPRGRDAKMPANVYDFRDTISRGFHFCGVSEEQFSVNGKRYQWPRGSKLSWGLAFDRLGQLNDQDLKGMHEQIFREISEVCQLDFFYVANFKTANLMVQLANLDGRGGTLADQQLPVGNVSANTKLVGRIDISEEFSIFDGPGGGRIDARRMMRHELGGHGLGLGHQPSNDKRPSLLAPMYNENLWLYQPADIEELQIRYGARETPPVPKPPVVPPTTTTITGFTSALQVDVPALVDGKWKAPIKLDLGINGKKYRAVGNAIEVAA